MIKPMNGCHFQEPINIANIQRVVADIEANLENNTLRNNGIDPGKNTLWRSESTFYMVID